MPDGKGCVITKTIIPINKVRITGEFIGIFVLDRNYNVTIITALGTVGLSKTQLT